MTSYALFVHDNPGFGGVGHIAAQLADGLQACGWEVEHWNVRHARGDAPQLAARLSRRGGIAIATQNFSAAYACAGLAALSRRPWVMWVHGPILDVLRMGRTSWAKRAWLRWFYRRTRFAVCSSEASRTSLVEFCGAAHHASQVEVIRNTAHPAFFTQQPLTRAAGHELGLVGRVSSEKQPLLALQVLRALPSQYKLHVVGDGPLTPELRAAGVEEIAAGRLVLAGAQAIDAQTYRRWDVSLLCSVYEGYPLVPLESMASGVPVVCTPIPAAVEMLGTHAPYMLAHDATPQAIAQAVLQLAQRDAAAVQRDIASINHDHDPHDFVRRWDELLTQRLRG
jgi:glycosyltransferase involved in cell wall biosynthesis